MAERALARRAAIAILKFGSRLDCADALRIPGAAGSAAPVAQGFGFS
jgi:hypothetical protein